MTTIPSSSEGTNVVRAMTAAQHAFQWWIGRIAFVALMLTCLRFTYRLWQQARQEPPKPPTRRDEPTTAVPSRRRTGRSFEPVVGAAPPDLRRPARGD